MKTTWTLHVENFAKIKTANIKISPLMCFVGDNNSGKSYLMSLLWGLLTFGSEIFPKAPSDSKVYKNCEDWLRNNWMRENIELDSEVSLMYINWFNELLANSRKAFVKRIFNYDIDIDKISINDYFCSQNRKILWSDKVVYIHSKSTSITLPVNDKPTREVLLVSNIYICWDILMSELTAPYNKQFVKGNGINKPVYLPASRTGFMLTFPMLLESSFQVTFSAMAENSSVLTAPYVSFLQLITKFGTKRKSSRFSELINFIEKDMTKGSINAKKEMLPDIKYQPTGSDKDIPLYVSSSVVSEVSALTLLLKSNTMFKTIIIEEPEAHLHPNLQQKIAKLIINLMNMGIQVWITTHSDTILQHINNMLKLSAHDKSKELMQEFNYTEKDLLKMSQVSMYQFTTADNTHTKLDELTADKYGFVIPTFNNALEKLVKEVYAFQEVN